MRASAVDGFRKLRPPLIESQLVPWDRPASQLSSSPALQRASYPETPKYSIPNRWHAVLPCPRLKVIQQKGADMIIAVTAWPLSPKTPPRGYSA